MKRLCFLFFFCVMFFVPLVTFGQTIGLPQFPDPTKFDFSNEAINPIGDFTLERGLRMVGLVLRVIYIIFFIYAAINIVFVAWDYLRSEGGTKVADAQKRLIYAGVAIAVALISFSINNIVRNVLTRN